MRGKCAVAAAGAPAVDPVNSAAVGLAAAVVVAYSSAAAGTIIACDAATTAVAPDPAAVDAAAGGGTGVGGIVVYPADMGRAVGAG